MKIKNSWTGERLETFITDETMHEHLHRYAIALQFAQGKKILDIACGEGYGTNILSTKAIHVTGIDIDSKTIDNANIKYKNENLEFKNGDIKKIPVADNSFDLITCFETIEHVDEQEKILTELKRVLTDNGILIISTPEKSNYSDKTNHKNPFHKKELYGYEFKEMIDKFFKNTDYLIQSSVIGSLIQNENKSAVLNTYTGNYTAIIENKAIPVMYRIAIASDNELPKISNSIFYDQNKLSEKLTEETNKFKKTFTYRISNILLMPVKFFISLFKK